MLFFVFILFLFVVLLVAALIPVLVRFGGAVVLLIVIVGLLTERGARSKAPPINLFPASVEGKGKIVIIIKSIMRRVCARDGQIGD